MSVKFACSLQLRMILVATLIKNYILASLMLFDVLNIINQIPDYPQEINKDEVILQIPSSLWRKSH